MRAARLSTLATAFATTVAAVMTAVVVWGLDRGFDFTDEGAQLLGFQGYQPITPSLSRYELLSRTLLGWAVDDVVGARVVHLVLALVSAAVLTWGLQRWLVARDPTPRHVRALLPLSTVGVLAGWLFGPPSLSYNHLTSFALLSAAGLTFAALTADGRPRDVLLAVAGLLLGLDFFVKFSSSIAATLVTLMALLLQTDRPLRGRTRDCVALLGGCALGLVAYFVLVESPGSVHNAYRQSKSSDPAHDPGTLLHTYLHDLRTLGLLAALAAPAFAVIVALGLLRLRLSRRLSWGAGIALVLFLAGAVWERSYVRDAADLRALPLITLLTLTAAWLYAAASGLAPRGRPRVRELAALCILLALPICGGVGTTNGLIVQSVFFLPAWFALAYVAVTHIRPELRAAIAAVIIVVLASASLLRFFEGYVWRPYRVDGPLTKQSVRAEATGPLASLRVDPKTAAFLHGVEAARRRLHTDRRNIIGVYRMPGVVYALGGMAPADRFMDPADAATDCRRLVASKPPAPLILVNEAALATTGLLPCLSDLGIDPAKMKPLATFAQPGLGLALVLDQPRY